MDIPRLCRTFRVAALIACGPLLLSVGGCATLAHGAMQQVTLTSEPPGANVFVDNRNVGVTPVRVEMKRRNAHITVRFEKAGYTTAALRVTRTISRWLAADVAVSLNPMAAQGLNSVSQWPAVAAQALGMTLGIDFLTGAAFAHPGVVHMVLVPIPPGLLRTAPSSPGTPPAVVPSPARSPRP